MNGVHLASKEATRTSVSPLAGSDHQHPRVNEGTSMAVSQSTLPPLPQQEGVEFRHVPGFPGYCISDTGIVMTCRASGGKPRVGEVARRFAFKPRWTPLKPKSQIRTGHLSVSLLGHWKTVANLVLTTFVGPAPNGHEARHYPDQDPKNNNLGNLSWATRLVNQRDRYENGTAPVGEKNGECKLTPDEVREIRRIRDARELPQQAVADRFGVTKTQVRNIEKRKSWRHLD